VKEWDNGGLVMHMKSKEWRAAKSNKDCLIILPIKCVCFVVSIVEAVWNVVILVLI
jgi:hypothetical protein